jgi:hypothetical protein
VCASVNNGFNIGREKPTALATVTTAELSIQFTDGTPPNRYTAERTNERFDAERWKRLEWKTPNSSGGVAPPAVHWDFISSKATISVEALCNANGVRVCRIPSFVRAEIYPARFGYPPRFESDYADEAEVFFEK